MKSQCLCLSLFLLKCTSLDATKDDIYQWEDANIPAIIQRKRGAPPFPALPTGNTRHAPFHIGIMLCF